ncbi:MAG: hypothetical protein ACI8ZM_000488 [Crocinitomix sp.]|jgi:hypothetical protein
MAVTKFHQNDQKSKSRVSQKSKPGSSIAAKALGVQSKLTIGQPNDKYEQEADSIADKVMLMPERGTIQRKCNGCEQEEDVSSVASAKDENIQKKPLASAITPWVQKQATSENENRTPSLSLESQLNSSKSGGNPLPKTTRSFMENGIGADFGNVKIHTGSNAVQMSQELGAQAFTHGNHVYFNSGKYNPSSSQGKHLLAHELVHTVQQGNRNKLSRSYIGLQLARKKYTKHVMKEYNSPKARRLKVGNSQDIGNHSEIMSRRLMRSLGYKLIGGGKDHKGIDSVWVSKNASIKPKYVVIEAKTNYGGLKITKDGPQLSEQWTKNRLNQALSDSPRREQHLKQMQKYGAARVLVRYFPKTEIAKTALLGTVQPNLPPIDSFRKSWITSSILNSGAKRTFRARNRLGKASGIIGVYVYQKAFWTLVARSQKKLGNYKRNNTERLIELKFLARIIYNKIPVEIRKLSLELFQKQAKVVEIVKKKTMTGAYFKSQNAIESIRSYKNLLLYEGDKATHSLSEPKFVEEQIYKYHLNEIFTLGLFELDNTYVINKHGVILSFKSPDNWNKKGKRGLLDKNVSVVEKIKLKNWSFVKVLDGQHKNNKGWVMHQYLNKLIVNKD